MSSTEQKNVTQHFIANCFTYGIIPTIKSKAFANYTLQCNSSLFGSLQLTTTVQCDLEKASDRVSRVRDLFPILHNAPVTTRVGPLLLKLCASGPVFFGNMAVLRMYHAIITRSWGILFRDTPAIRHAKRHTGYVYAMLGPASYGQIGRNKRNADQLASSSDELMFRIGSDVFEYLERSGGPNRAAKEVRSWCSRARQALNVRGVYRTAAQAASTYDSISSTDIASLPDPPSFKCPLIRFTKKSRRGAEFYYQGQCLYIKVFRWKYVATTSPSPASASTHLITGSVDTETRYDRVQTDIEVYAFNKRDLNDLKYLLHAASAFQSYTRRRTADLRSPSDAHTFRAITTELWGLYTDVAGACGREWRYRNKLGVYFDVLQWRYLAWRSGDEFYDHSYIMRKKLESKGLVGLPSQELLLTRLKNVQMDIAVDLLGIYKASIYPEVDPFQVVDEQQKLHYSRHNTDWSPESPEAERFDLTRRYMWYLGIRVLKGILKAWPGVIREGVDEKDWHAHYHARGIPGDSWRDACDVDLTGCLPQVSISNEQYMRQQDSACAPPTASEFRDFWAMRGAPRRHKRKILYAVQEPVLPDLPQAIEHLNDIGKDLPDGYIGRVNHALPFSVDIVTGSRCERHKDAPRPFYAASSPWGCILSYLDGITRDFLMHVPQCMLGKSNRQKYLDISSAARQEIASVRYFYVSDDKAKYSPRMDPQSQQLPAEFFAEIFGLPAFRAYGPIMYHSELYYRVCGHLVHYGSNGTDREGMRGACNTWLEIVAQGLATRLSREKGISVGKSVFLSFIDDGLRRFQIPIGGKSPDDVRAAARSVLDEVIFGLRVLGRELSWDKTFVSSDMYVILNEIMYEGSHMSSGLKSFVTVGDVELKEVMSAADYEQLYFGKMKGALGVGAPLDLCHYMYIFETLMSHYKMGLRMQDNKRINAIDYRLFCMVPISMGGAGIRSMTQMNCTEIANATKEGIGNFARLCQNFFLLKHCFISLLSQPLEEASPIDFMREPEQVHIAGARIRTQRVAATVRRILYNVASNPLSRGYMEQDRVGMEVLAAMGEVQMSSGDVSAEETRLLYAMSPVAFIDEFIQKLASSSTISQLLSPETIASLRRSVRRDFVSSANLFQSRIDSNHVIMCLKEDAAMWMTFSHWFV